MWWRRGAADAPWARSYGAFVKLGLFVVALRLVFSVFLGSSIPGSHTVLTLPELPLPDWAQGVRIGGRVTAEQLVFSLYEGMKLATLLICVGAANALANPARLLKSLPGALYEAGVAVVVAMTFAPNMVADVVRLRTARRLRGAADRRGAGGGADRAAGAGGGAGAVGGGGRVDGRARVRAYGPGPGGRPAHHERPHPGRAARGVRRYVRAAGRAGGGVRAAVAAGRPGHRDGGAAARRAAFGADPLSPGPVGVCGPGWWRARVRRSRRR